MTVDVVWIREQKLYRAQRVCRSRLLTNLQFFGFELAHYRIVNFIRANDFSFFVDDLIRVLVEILFILFDRGQQLLFNNALGNIPVRPENQEAHGLRKDRRLMVRSFSHNGLHGQHLLITVRMKRELGNIDHNHWRMEIARQPAPALQRELQLDHATAQRDHEFGKSVVADGAVREQSVTLLEMVDRVHQSAFIYIRRRRRSCGGLWFFWGWGRGESRSGRWGL